MTRKFTAILAALALGASLFAPSAEARDYGRHHDGGYYGHHRGYYHNDHGDAVAAGVVGLVLGLAIGSAANNPPPPQARCYDNYQRCAAPPPPPGYYRQGYAPGGYDPRYQQDPRYADPRYADPRYADPRQDPNSAYEEDYGGGPGYEDQGYAPEQQQCTRSERQWDRYAQRYVMVDVPC